MKRVAALGVGLGAGLAITLTAFGSFAADQPAAAVIALLTERRRHLAS